MAISVTSLAFLGLFFYQTTSDRIKMQYTLDCSLGLSNMIKMYKPRGDWFEATPKSWAKNKAILEKKRKYEGQRNLKSFWL